MSTSENNKGTGVGSPPKKTAADSSGGSSTASTPAAAIAAAIAADTNPADATTSTVKIDPITALQDDIDGLSLAMFEGLRGLRDAVAPESGNLAGEGNPAAAATDENTNTTNNGNGNGESNKPAATPDMDDMWYAYQRKDPSTVQMMKDIVSHANTTNTATSTTTTQSTTPTPTPDTTKSAAASIAAPKEVLPKNLEDFARLYHTKMEVETDTLLVTKLAGTVLAKSRQIDKRVDDYLTPVRTRTRDQQMARIQELLTQNQQVTVELEAAHLQAKARRDVCRRFIRDHTCAALGIEQIND